MGRPIGAVRVGRVDGQFIINPTQTQRLDSDLDLVYVGNATDVIMIEGAANEIPEEDFIKSLHFAQEAVTKICAQIEALRERAGKEKRVAPLLEVKDEFLEIAYQVAGDRIEAALYQPSKVERQKAVGALEKEVRDAILEKDAEANSFAISQAFDYMQKKAFRISILDNGKRCDGRDDNTIRPLSAETGIIPRTHGSALFARGETQALSLATLAPSDEAQFVDNYTGGEDSKRFMLHYNFPPFSVGETGRMGGINRREIGHGALAERSVAPILPSVEDFPYAVRIVSEIMESNGSTSMASVCSGSLSLLDAGVPISRHVAGISVGLVTEFDDSGTMKRHNTLLDIIGTEDFFGDMDFKLCGTSEGVTGYQLDLKLPGLPMAILEEGIHKAKAARTKVLEFMNGIIETPAEISDYAPRIELVKINPEKIGELIGPGGKNIKSIQAETGADINIQDDGTVHIYSTKKESLERAKQLVAGISAEIEVGKTYTGKVVSTTNFGAFMAVLPGKDGMIHISELADYRVKAVEDIVKVGDVIEAKCIGIDDRGRVKMSRRAVLEEKEEAANASSEGEGGQPEAETADA